MSDDEQAQLPTAHETAPEGKRRGTPRRASPMPPDYDALLGEVRGLLQTARDRAYQAVDNIKVQAYWQVGERIVRSELAHKDRADYGARVYEQLSRDLHVGRTTLFRIVRFYRAYPLMATLSTQISWIHYDLLSAIGDHVEREFYEGEVVRGAWSTRQLEEHIKAGLYRRAMTSPRPRSRTAQVAPAVRAEDAFRSLYNFAVPGLPAGFDEAQLEVALLANFQRVLEELGPLFYIRRSQQPILIDGQYHSVDLELYHRAIPATVLCDLKLGPFRDAYVGQMNKYVAYYRERVPLYEWEKPTIGLIVCESAGRDEVRYALAGLEEKIFVAEYQVRLPTAERIRERLQELAHETDGDET